MRTAYGLERINIELAVSYQCGKELQPPCLSRKVREYSNEHRFLKTNFSNAITPQTMKTLQQIAKELIAIVKPSHIYDKNNDWIFYTCIIGYYKGGYYDICFSKNKYDEEIEINFTTHQPKFFLELIKKIEPKAKVTYTIIKKEKITV